MVLKEAYRYQNYLTTLINSGTGLLNDHNFITTTEQKHFKSKSIDNVDDERIVKTKPYELDKETTPMRVVEFLLKVIEEKEKLSLEIEKAKMNAEININSSISMNKIRHDFLDTLRHMATTKSVERDSEGVGYKINNDGNQVSYRYPIKEIVTIDYNRNDINGLIRKFQKKCDGVSNKIDREEILLDVEYTPVWDIDTPFEDAVLQ